MSQTAPVLSCPRCAGPLQTWSDFRGLIGGCAGCGGVWAEVKTLKAATLRPQAIGHQSKHRARGEIDLSAPIDCPRCASPMERYVVGGGDDSSGGAEVELDRCVAHGHWFDGDELGRVAAALKAAAQHQRTDASADEHRYAVTAENLNEVQFRANVEKYKDDPLGMMMSDSWAAEVAWYEWIGGLLQRLFGLGRR